MVGPVELLLVPEFGNSGTVDHELEFFPTAPEDEPVRGAARVDAEASQGQVELVLGPVGMEGAMTPQRRHFDVFLIDLFVGQTGASLRV